MNAARLLCLLHRARPDESTWQSAQALASGLSGDEQDQFFSLIDRNSVWIRVSERARTRPSWLPARLREDPRWARMEKKAQSLLERERLRFSQVQKLLQAHSAAGIDVIALKGSVFGPVLYRDPFYKRMNDFDYLIRFEQAPRALEIVRGLGFESVGALLGKKEISASRHHTPPFYNSDLSCVLGIHWGLISPKRPERPDLEAIWNGKVRFQVGDAQADRMSWEHNLLHLCLHLPRFKAGIRELADVVNVARFADPAIDWLRFEGEARRWNALRPVFHVLSLAQAVDPGCIPQGLLDRLSQDVPRELVRETEKRASFGPSLIQFRTLHIAQIEKAFARSRLSPDDRERFEGWKESWVNTFFPPRSELGALTGQPLGPGRFAGLRARVRAAAVCWKALAQDHGHALLGLVTAFNALDAARIRLRMLMGRGRFTSVKHPAFGLLEQLE